MARAVQRPAARRDFLIHYVYLWENAGVDTAKRFRRAVEKAYQDLAKMPRIGAPRKASHRKHANIRIWPVEEFPNYLIAYRPRKTGVAIERLIHAKQDFQRVLR